MTKITAVEWDIVHARVKASAATHRLTTTSLGFLYLVLGQFFPGRDDDLAEMVTDGSNDRGIDAIEIIEKDDQAEVYLFQAKYREGQQSTDRTINETEVHKILNFIRELFDKSENLTDPGNIQLSEAVLRIWSLHERGVFCRYKILFCSNDQGLSPSARAILVSALSEFQSVTFEHYGPNDLLRDIGARDRKHESGFLQVIGKEAFERSDGDIRGVIATVSAQSYVKLISSSDGHSVKRHLFDDNLRIYLGETGGYNSAIISTATSADCHLFWYLNNGITITCEKYSYNKGHANPKIKIENFQIVNGAQTSHSLIEAARLTPDLLKDVMLTVRVYATDRQDIVQRVAVATNSQARIQNRDLKANDPILRKLEIAFASRGYFFERKRQMYSDKDPSVRIDALKLGQIITAYYLEEPDRAKTVSDAIFDHQFNRVFKESYDMDELCRLFELHQLIEEMRESYTARRKNMIAPETDEHYLVFGHWFILYAAKLILLKSGSKIPEKTNAKALVLEAISLVARIGNRGGSIAHYQMFRSSKTKSKILSELMGAQMNLFEQLEPTHKSEP